MKKKKLIKNVLIGLGVAGVAGFIYKDWYIHDRIAPIGNNNWRSFNRRDGVPKISFENSSEAAKVALHMISKYGEPFDSYLCSDGQFRVGHASRLSNMPFVAVANIQKVLKKIFF